MFLKNLKRRFHFPRPHFLASLLQAVGNLLLLASCLSCQVQEIQEGNNFTLTRKSYIPVKFVWRRQNITKQVSSLNNFYHKIPYITRKLLHLLHLLYLLLHLQHLCLYQYPHSPESSQLTPIQWLTHIDSTRSSRASCDAKQMQQSNKQHNWSSLVFPSARWAQIRLSFPRTTF